MRRLISRLLWLPCLLLLGCAVWGGYYVCNHGFSRHWRVRVSEEFRRRGMDLYVHRLTLDPIQGFVAREVRIYDAADPDRVLATIDRVALDVNLTNLLEHRPFLDAVDLRNADLSLPLDADDPKSDRITVSHLDARVIFPPHEWYVSQAEATMYGIRVSARGRLQNPEAFHPEPHQEPRPGGESRSQAAFQILREIGALHYGGETPHVDILFGGDLSDVSSLYADATILGERIRRGGAELTRVFAALGLRDRVVELKQCDISDSRGTMNVSASYNLDTAMAAVELRSTLNPDSLTRVFHIGDPLDDWHFLTPPRLELSGTASFAAKSPAGLVTGHVALGPFDIKETEFTGAGADFSWDGSRWYVRKGWLQNRTGTLSGRALSRPGGFKAAIESGINPNSLRDLLQGDAGRALREWNFQQTPRLSLGITGASADPASWRAQGTVVLGRTRMRGVPLNHATSSVEVQGLLFAYRDFNIQRDEGAATGSFSYDFGKHEAWLENVHAHFNTTEAAVWIDPDLVRQLAPYRFKAAPALTLDGFVQCANDKGTHLDVHVDAPAGMDYAFCKRTLTFPRISGNVRFTEHHVRIEDVSASLCHGSIQGAADIALGKASHGYTANLALDQVDFASITRLYFKYGDSHGLLSGTFDFGGKSEDPRTLYGRGFVRVTDGNVFAIPVLGPFSGILNTVVPGMGYNVAREGTCDFDVRDGVITTRDFLIKGKGFSMIGDGRIHFLDDKLNLNIRLNAQGLPGVILFPVSKLLEYAGTGTLENPAWRPVLLEGGPKREPAPLTR